MKVKVLFPLILLLLASGVVAAQPKTHHDTKPKQNIFVFHTDEFWLNLHHFLYVLGRAQNKTRDGSREAVVNAPTDQERGLERLKPQERAIWKDAVAAYASTFSARDIVFDDPLPALTGALAKAGNAKSLKGTSVEPTTAKILEDAAPIYRKAWWSNHHAANQIWESAVEELVNQHGAAVLAFITNAYGMKWPEAGFGVHISGYTNWAGAYSTRGNLLVISSLNKENRGANSLEIIFHEGMHQWDGQVFYALQEEVRKQGKLVPQDLSHGMIFMTAGEAVRRVIPDHVPYGETAGVWQRGLAPYKSALDEIWKPYLDGKGRRDEALAELIKRTAKGSRAQ